MKGDDKRANNRSLSNKLPLNVEFLWGKGDLQQQDYQNIPGLQKYDEIALSSALCELFFNEELVY